MKKIFAIMNEDMVEPTRKLLNNIGISGVQIMHVLGKGIYDRNNVNFTHSSSFRGGIANYYLNNKGLITDSVLRKNRELIDTEIERGFQPKRMVVFTTQDSETMTTIHMLIKIYLSLGKGKGRIFVCPVCD